MKLTYVILLGLVASLLLTVFIYEKFSLRAVHWRWHSQGATSSEHSEVAAINISTSPINKGVWKRSPCMPIPLNSFSSAISAYRASLQTSEAENISAELRKNGFPWIAKLIAISSDSIYLPSSKEELAFAEECRKFSDLLQAQEDADVFRALADCAEQASNNQLALLLAR